MPAFALKAAATLLTLGTAVVAAFYVTANVKNPTAPLHPPVLGASSVALRANGGRLHLTPAVQGSDVQPVTSTYAS